MPRRKPTDPTEGRKPGDETRHGKHRQEIERPSQRAGTGNDPVDAPDGPEPRGADDVAEARNARQEKRAAEHGYGTEEERSRTVGEAAHRSRGTTESWESDQREREAIEGEE